MWRAAIEACFYGHLFYGVCAVAQVVETSVQLALPMNGWLMAWSFIGTVLFYGFPYTRGGANSDDPRIVWYRRHRRVVDPLRQFATCGLIALSAWMAISYRPAILDMTLAEWIVLLIFPAVGALYYGAPAISKALTLRRLGWPKPFVIGFVWAGICVAYPILFARLQHGHHAPLSFFAGLLFVKTLMFVAVLAILFDIKDHAADQRFGLSTVVTLVGIRRTLFQVSLPLTLLGIATFLSYATVQHLTVPRVLLVLGPFVLLLAGIVSLRRPRSILYYLSVIDGLMLTKALLDILAMRF